MCFQSILSTSSPTGSGAERLPAGVAGGINLLDDDLLQEVFCLCDAVTLSMASQTCTSFEKLISIQDQWWQ